MNRRFLLYLLILLAAWAIGGAPASADNCARIAASEAARAGAEVLSARTEQEGGQPVCVIKLRVPGSGGQPPRVRTIRAGQ